MFSERHVATIAAAVSRREGRDWRTIEKQLACSVLDPRDEGVCMRKRLADIDRKRTGTDDGPFSPGIDFFVFQLDDGE